MGRLELFVMPGWSIDTRRGRDWKHPPCEARFAFNSYWTCSFLHNPIPTDFCFFFESRNIRQTRMATRLTEREIVADAIKEVLNTYGDDEKLKVLLAPGAELKFGLFCIKIVKLISTSVSVKPQIAFKRFHQLSVSKLLISWKELFSVLRLPVARTVLLQSVNRPIFNALLKEKCTGKQQKLPKPVSLLSEEENAIRYASGFIAFKLMKKFENKDSSKVSLWNASQVWQ